MQVAVDIATPGNDNPRTELLLKSVESGLARSLIQSAVTCIWSHQEIDSTRCTNSRCDVIDTADRLSMLCRAHPRAVWVV